MTNTVILKRSSVANAVPTVANLTEGELALNYTDGNLFYKTAANTISVIASNKFLSVTGNVTGGNIVTSGIVTATGNITGGNIITTGELKSTGTFLIGTQAFYPQGSDGFSVNENFNAGNSTVTAYHYTSGTGRSAVVFDVAVTNQFTTGFGATGTAATNQFVQYSENANTTWVWRTNVGISAPNLNGGTLIANINPNGNLYTIGTISSTGNITGGNVLTAGILSATGNVTGNFFIGNGSQLTGLAATYGNANVVANLAALGTNPVSTTGNITGGNITLSTLVTANSVVSRLLTITSSVSNVLLDATSSQNILVNGSTSQYVFLPNAQTLITGATYAFNDNSSQPVYICYNDGTLLGTLAAGGLIEVQLLTNSTSNGTWDRHSGIPSYVGWGSTGLTMGNGNITGATIISASANVTGGNVLTGGLISATGNITGGNVLGGANVNATTHTGTTVSVSANITGGNVLTAGLISATSNITGGNVLFGSGITSGTGNITGGNVLTGGLISATGNITGGNILGGANVNATTHTGTTVSVSANITGGNVLTGGLISATANITGGNILFGAGIISGTGNITGGNVLTGGLISATGNITGGNVLGGANVNATTHTGTTVSVSANVTGGNVLTGGLISATGNITGGNVLGGANVNATTHTGTTVSVSANITGGNVLTGGLISATGNITGGNLTIAGNTATITTANYSIGYLNIPQISFSANATAALVDSGKHYYSTTSGNLALTIPTNATVAFPTGTALSLVVQASGNVLVNAAVGVTLYMGGNSTAGNRVVSGYGMATIMKVATDTWFINGTGVA